MTVSLFHARLLAAALALVLLGLWELLVRQWGLSALVLPAPSAIAASLWTGLATGYFWPHIRATLQALLLGLAAGSAIGLLAGMALAESELLERVLKPYVVVSQVVPKLALAPLFVLWFGFGMLPTVLITALICFFPLMENTLTGLRQVDAQRLQLFRMLGATRLQTLLRLKLPTGLPAILAGLRVAVVLALVGAVVAEFMGASRGLGAVVIAAQGMMDTTLMFAALVLIAAMGLLLYQACLVLERRLLRSRAA
ncbi:MULTISPECIES: ABC transporter permease [Delftia]|jgi:NitT/TauT family transport system permease protein|uniref:Binding-protein-dependent transport systems inner membrane component n=3 Tax=Delftia TaxID=80865 RepID=A9C345_DELAS|nr:MULTISPECIES: ABC transporter permease [Delftia]MBA4002335.1 ABC transporter permease [Delftia sp.]ABX37156.1 binding-protein-dependent transport systems inner membrane component [Delftia acidovorans SPH-1]AEF89311.1 ABC-type transporter, integral membrane subunit [Delftia sp. Cs1-4]ATH16157.1 ABC transporter permease [Delftia acidovorans]KFJ08496.1 binding--dependent transport system inner membrane component family protein [Delftia acidovorans]